MSHVAKCDVLVPEDLSVLEKILPQFGLELRRNQTTWNWYGTFLDDWNDETRAAGRLGWDPAQFGKGSHAIGVIGKPGDYEIGLIPRRDGGPGYELLYDSYGPEGRALEQAAGMGLVKIKNELAAEITTRTLARQGYRVSRSLDAKTGAVVLTAHK